MRARPVGGVVVPTRKIYRARRLSRGLVLLLLVAGCSGGSAEESGNEGRGPYYDDIIAAGQEPGISVFERSVFEDGEITRAEYEEAVQNLVACADTQGVKVGIEPQGQMYSYSHIASPGAGPVVDACSEEHTMQIEPLYGSVVNNPEKRDPEEVLVECFIASGLVSADYTVERYREERDASARTFTVGSESGNEYSSARIEGSGQFSFDIEDPRHRECSEDPLSY